MVVLGLILIILAVVFGADIVLENTVSSAGKIFHQSVSNISLGGVFLAGAVTALVLALGLWLVFGGLARARRRRLQRKTVAEQTAAQQGSLEAENERLARQLEEERRAREASPVSPYDEEEHGGGSSVSTADLPHERTATDQRE